MSASDWDYAQDDGSMLVAGRKRIELIMRVDFQQ